jgi:predicted RNA-binding protein with PUA-like domain
MAKRKNTARRSSAPQTPAPQKPASRSGRGPKRKQAFWLVKSEPHVFSIDDLANAPEQTTYWDGVRNYQARNILRDEMKRGDHVLFYHSNADPPGVAGIAKVVREGYPDHTAFEPDDPHYDPKSDPSEPRWYMVDIQLVEKFKRELPLQELKQVPALKGLMLLQKGSRLSVQPVSAEHFETIQQLAKKR